MKKRAVSLFLTLALLLMCIPFGVVTTSAATSGDFTYSIVDGGAVIYKAGDQKAYSGSATDLVIPATLGGYPVVKIGAYAFINCHSLESVVIPSTVTEIDERAFYRCINLTEINIPNGVQTIGTRAFTNCTELTTVVLPATVTLISDYAFYDCTALQNLTIYNKNTNIVANAFNGCTNLTICSYGGGSVEDVAEANTIPFVCLHKWNNATCTSAKTCTECRATQGASLGHTWVNATCTTPKTCSACGMTQGTALSHNFPTESVSNYVTVLQSPHNYYNHYSNYWTATQSGASELRVTFSSSTYVENNWDYIRIYGRNNTLIGTYTGSALASRTITVPGDYIKISLSTDGSVTKYGFYATVTAITATPVWTVRTEPTCTTVGEKYMLCSRCGQEETVELPAYGHNYDQYGVCSTCMAYTTSGDFTYYVADGGAVIFKAGDQKAYSGSATNLVIPATLGGYPVVKIGAYAFINCHSLQSVVIPSTVTEIDQRAFYRCINLTEINIPDGVHSIGTRAFTECVSLTELELPASVTSIDTYAFYCCTALERLTVYNKNATIGNNALSGCTNLTVFSYAGGTVQAEAAESGTPFVCVHTWVDATFTTPKTCSHCGATDGDVVPRLLGTHTTGNGITLSVYRYGDSEEYHMTVSGNGPMKNWSYMNVYSYAPYLTSITIEEGITAIPVGGFTDTTALKRIELPSTVTELPYGIFANLTALEEVVLPSTLTTINGTAFQNCTALTSIDLPEGLTTMGYAAFMNSGLTEVTIPDSVTTMGRWVFANCRNLNSVTFGASRLAGKTIPARTFSGCTALKEVDFGTRLRSIDDYAFNQCGLETLVLPANVKVVDNAAFYKCASLKSVTIADGGVTYLGWAAFYSCGNLEGIDLGNSLTKISTWVFTACGNLTSVTIPDTVTDIGRCSFKWCANLESIDLSDGMTAIKDEMFVGCTRLRNITLPANLQSIGAMAFRKCRALTSLDIPEGVTIGTNAFVGSGMQ